MNLWKRSREEIGERKRKEKEKKRKRKKKHKYINGNRKIVRFG